jgi:hypothetical protein
VGDQNLEGVQEVLPRGGVRDGGGAAIEGQGGGGGEAVVRGGEGRGVVVAQPEGQQYVEEGGPGGQRGTPLSRSLEEEETRRHQTGRGETNRKSDTSGLARLEANYGGGKRGQGRLFRKSACQLRDMLCAANWGQR